MGNESSQTMPERIEAIQRMLEEGRKERGALADGVSELRIGVAAMLSRMDSQRDLVVDIRREQGTMADRLRGVEIAMARLPGLEERVGQLVAQHGGLENRVRTLETANAGTQVVHSGLTATAGAVLRYLVLGGICALVGWLASSAAGGA